METPPYAGFLMPNAKVQYKQTYTPPELASRTSIAPFLFKCCRVGYNKESRRLEIRKGEYVGKKVTTELGRRTNLQDSEYVDITVDVDTDDDDDMSGKKKFIIYRSMMSLETQRGRRWSF